MKVASSLLLVTGAVGFGTYEGGEFGGFQKDVCVVGGGASGSYAAASLAMRGYDVVLFEPQDRLGGNCNLYEYEGPTGETVSVNWGVTLWRNVSVVRDFLELFEVDYGGYRGGGQGIFYDPTRDVLVSPSECDGACQIGIGVAVATYVEQRASFGAELFDSPEVPNFADLPSVRASVKRLR